MSRFSFFRSVAANDTWRWERRAHTSRGGLVSGVAPSCATSGVCSQTEGSKKLQEKKKKKTGYDRIAFKTLEDDFSAYLTVFK